VWKIDKWAEFYCVIGLDLRLVLQQCFAMCLLMIFHFLPIPYLELD